MMKGQNPFQDMFAAMDWSKLAQGMDWSKMQGMDWTKMMGQFNMPQVDMSSFMSTQQKNIEAVSAANKLLMESVQAVAQRQGEIMRQTMEEVSKASQEMMTQGKPEEKLAQQADMAKAAFEKAIANLREIAEMASKANHEMADVLNARVAESMDEVKTIVNQMKAK